MRSAIRPLREWLKSAADDEAVRWPLGVFLDALEHYSRKPDGSTDQSFPASEPPPALHIAGLGG